MKDIKTFLIGFLSCVCLFLVMGQTDAKVKSDKEWIQEQWENIKIEWLEKGLSKEDFLTAMKFDLEEDTSYQKCS